MFVLFSHNFIINVYHHYCSYSISHCSSCCQMKKFSFPSFAFFCWRVNEKHQKIWVMRKKHWRWREEKTETKFPIPRDFRISKGYILVWRGFKKLSMSSFLVFRHMTVYLSSHKLASRMIMLLPYNAAPSAVRFAELSLRRFTALKPFPVVSCTLPLMKLNCLPALWNNLKHRCLVSITIRQWSAVKSKKLNSL